VRFAFLLPELLRHLLEEVLTNGEGAAPFRRCPFVAWVVTDHVRAIEWRLDVADRVVAAASVPGVAGRVVGTLSHQTAVIAGRVIAAATVPCVAGRVIGTLSHQTVVIAGRVIAAATVPCVPGRVVCTLSHQTVVIAGRVIAAATVPRVAGRVIGTLPHEAACACATAVTRDENNGD
jgi:hypothetical protein